MQSTCSDQEIDQVRVYLKKKHLSRQQVLDTSYQRAVNDFGRMIEFAIKNYELKRIWQWGSLLNRKHFSEISDIDIAVEGMSSIDEYYSLLADLSVMTEFPLDLVEMERIGEENASHIRRFGRMVYERVEP